MIEEFKKYVDKFDMSDENISRKYFHSLRVKDLCRLISTDIGFSDYDILVAQVIGLLHDYGRFMQWTKYHTYRDSDSIDHADYGIEQLFNNNEISNFWDNIKDYDEIYDAIKYHNKISIPNYLSDNNKNFCKIIRDADKIDIMYLYVIKELKLDEEGEISPKVIDSFNNEELINRLDENTGSDRIITLLAFVYDLNYKYSFKYLKENSIVERIYNNINNKEKYKYYFDKIIKYIDSKLNC